MNKPLYNDYGSWLRRQFPFRVQKISIDAGFSCPNRDGKVSHGDAPSAITARSTRPTVSQRRPLQSRLARVRSFSHANIPT